MASSRRKRRTNENERKNILREKIEIPEMIDSRLPHIEAQGNREIIVEGCKGIIEYSETRIKLNTGILLVGFTGDDIEIKNYSDAQTVISGNIMGIDFESVG